MTLELSKGRTGRGTGKPVDLKQRELKGEGGDSLLILLGIRRAT